MKILFQIKLFLFILQISTVAFAQDYEKIENSLTYYISVKGETAEKYNIYERMKKHNVPGVSVAIVANGELVWAKTWGVKDVSTNEPIEADTLFQAASVSKPLSAIAALRLVEEGLLSLDDPINNYLERWKIPENSFSKDTPVTLRGLLTHTAGTTISGFPGYKHNDTLPTTVQILNGEEPANTGAVFVDKEPNSSWRYSGGGYTIVQLAMEDVTGLKFPEIMRKYVLEPFGMDNSTYEIILSEEQSSKVSTAHTRKGEAFGIGDNLGAGKYHLYPEMAAASLWTNPTDLAKAIIHTNKIYHQNDGSILNAASAKEMFKIHQDNQGLGYALEVKEDKVIGFGHTGSNQGFKASLSGFFNGRGIVLMANGENGSMVMNEVFYGAFDQLHWPELAALEKEGEKVPDKIRNEYAGTYHFIDGEQMRIVKLENKEDGFYITIGDFIKSMKLYQSTDTDEELKFFVRSSHVATFDQKEDGTKTVSTFGMTYNKID